jgi:hypothetical protein
MMFGSTDEHQQQESESHSRAFCKKHGVCVSCRQRWVATKTPRLRPTNSALSAKSGMPATVRSSRGSRLDRCRGLGERFQEGFKRFPILGEHIDELYPIPYLGIAGNHGGGNQDCGSDGKLQVQISPHCKWKQIFDVAAVQTQIGSSATNRKTAPFSFYFKRHTYLYARGFPTFVPMRLDALLRGVRIRRRHRLS